jgi:hypothetical protein
LAEDPELVVSARFTPMRPAMQSLEVSLKRPVVSQPSSAASTSAT